MGIARLAVLIAIVGWSSAARATPVATPDPSPLAFGNVEVGKTSAAVTLTVTNTGTTNLTVTNAAINTGAADYAVVGGTTGAQNTIVAPSMTATWMIRCAPTTHGSRPGTFRVTSNSGGTGGTTTDVPMTCTGVRGVLVITPSTYDLGPVAEGGMATHNFTLSNTGNTTVSNVTATLDASLVGFSITSPTFPITLASGANMTVTVRFAPANETQGCFVGAGSPCTIVFSGGWGVTPTATVATLVVTGDGLDTGYDTSPAAPNALDFASVRFDQTKVMPVSVVNTSGTAYQLRLPTIALGTAMAGELAIQSCTKNSVTIACPTNAAPVSSSGVNDTIVLNIVCDPNNRVGMLDGTLTVTTDLPLNPNRMIPLKCNSTTAALTVNPSTQILDFGAVDLDANPVAVTRVIQLTNTGMATLNLANGSTAGANLARFAFTTIGAQAIAPGASFEVDVTYTPLLEKPPNQPDVASLTFPLSGILNGPSSIAIQIQGYGADRHVSVGAAPAFPDTFRNPGDAAPVLPIAITNTGYAPLTVSSLMVTGGPVWSVVNPDPVVVPAQGTHDLLVRFAPTAAGAAPAGRLVIINDDNAMPMAEIDLVGNGLARAVTMGPAVIDVGDTAVGVPVRLSDIAPDALLLVQSMDPTATFTIREVAIDGGPGFAIETADGRAPLDLELAPLGTQQLDVVLTPATDGSFETTATLYLDQDPEPHAIVTLRGRAAQIGVRGGGGCSTGSPTGLAAALALLALLVPRRRRVVVLAALGVTTSAAADDIATEAFRPTPATRAEAFGVQPADIGDDGEWVASAHASLATDPVAVEATIDGQLINTARPVTRRTGLELGGAYAFLGRFEAGLRLPLFQQSGETGQPSAYQVTDASGTALGDLGIHGTARILRAPLYSLGASLHVTVPTSTDGQFVGVDGPTARLVALASVRPVPRLSLAFNLGGVARASSTYSNDRAVRITQGSGLVWGAGASVAATDALRLSAEMFGEVVAQDDAMTGSLSPVELLAGARYRFGNFSIGLAGGRGLTSALGAPDLRGVLSIAYAPSTRREPAATLDVAAAVPAKTPPVDTDGDQVPDDKDACKDKPEDRDGVHDIDGCPEDDHDGDGLADAADKCPSHAEVVNGVEDNDGCPDVADDTGIAVSGKLSPTEAAEETFKLGRELMKEGKFAKACAAFEQSQRLDPQQGTQFNLAGCYIEIGKLATAWTMFRELARLDKNADRRAQAADAVAKLSARVPKLRLELSIAPQGLQVFINNVNANALVGLEAPLDFGTYELVAGAPGFKGWRKTIEIKDEGKVTHVKIELEPLPP